MNALMLPVEENSKQTNDAHINAVANAYLAYGHRRCESFIADFNTSHSILLKQMSILYQLLTSFRRNRVAFGKSEFL